MPFSNDPGKRESDKYCSLCFKDGKLCYEGTDLKEFQKVAYESMRSRGTNFFSRTSVYLDDSLRTTLEKKRNL